ncbi:MAG: TonB-dependent receptor [Bacteroidales bacterium]|nr:TonB-dependent receptor [Bacteroidales bacterium]
MKKAFLFITLLLISVWMFAQSAEKLMNCHFNNVSFEKFCNEVFQETGVRVFYQEKWVKNLKINLNANNITAKKAVSIAIENTGLKVSEWNNNLVILPDTRLITSLPPYHPETANEGSIPENTQKMTATEERYLIGRKPDVIHTIKVGYEGGPLTNGKASILGRVMDEETGEPVNFATCYVEETKTGSISGKNGFFTLVLKPGNYTVTINYMGYQARKYMLDILSGGKFIVTLRKTVYQIQEFVVHGDRQMNVTQKDPGIDKISMRSIKQLPMMMGERDILKVSGTLPGIVSTGEGSSGLNVRGGGSDQNAFYINKVPIFNTSHLFGFFPAFNSDIIKDFSVYKGYIPAMYGGRLSSVFNIMTRQGNMKRFTAHGGVSPVAANLEIEGPIKKDVLSFIFSGRSTYSDWILRRVKDPTISSSSANFYDYTGELSYNAQKTQMSLFFYHSYDHFRLSTLDDYNYSNNGASLDISHNLTNSLRADFSLIASQYGFTTIDQEQLPSAYKQAYKMGHYEVRADFTKTISNYNTLNFGGDAVLRQLDRGNVIPYGTESLLIPVALGKEQGFSGSLYLSDTYNPSPVLSITAGLRYTLYSPLGPSTVYNYVPGMPVDSRYVSDSVTYGNNVPIHWYSEPDVRAAVKYQTDENGSVKLAFNQMHQNLFMLNNTIAISPNVQWKLADSHITPSKSNQISLGVYRTLPKSGMEASVEIYYKEESGYPEFKDGASFLDSPHVETEVLQGKEKGYGVEFLLKRSNKRLAGWLSYTYSRSFMMVNGGQTWNSINNGETYPSNYDIPNVVNLVMDYHLSRRVTFSTIMTYQTGKPITYPVSVYYIDGTPYLDYSKRNAYRIPDYFRTDVSMSIEGNLKRHKLVHSSFVLSVYNLTGRKNPYSVYFNTSDGGITGYSYSVIGVPIFTVTWNFKLGNYASE